MRTFTDAQGVTVSYDTWAVDQPRAVIQLLHGVGEHSGRYGHVVRALNDAGYTVYADDHRGHGQTGLAQWPDQPEKLGRLGPGGHRAAVADVHHLTGLIRDENPAVPVVILGHSWGSLMAQILLNRHPSDYDGAVLSGTAYRMPGHMNSGDLNKGHAHLGSTGFEWLSRDPEAVQQFVDDPLTFDAKVLRLFGLADSLRLFGRPARTLNRSMPLLIQVGSDDALGGADSARRLAQSYQERSRLDDVTLITYPQARHEIYNETNRREVLADLTGWLDVRWPATPDGRGTGDRE